MSKYGKLKGPACKANSTGTVTSGHEIEMESTPSNGVTRNKRPSDVSPESVSISNADCTVLSSLDSQVVVKIIGRLKKFYSGWSDLASDRFILSYIKGYKLCFISTPTQDRLHQVNLVGKDVFYATGDRGPVKVRSY